MSGCTCSGCFVKEPEPDEKCEGCGKALEWGKQEIVWTADEVPLCAECGKSLTKEAR